MAIAAADEHEAETLARTLSDVLDELEDRPEEQLDDLGRAVAKVFESWGRHEV